MAKSIKQNKDKKKTRYIKKNKGNRKRVKRTNKNIKRVSLKKMYRGHKLRKGLHYKSGLHKSRSVRYGGKMKGGMISSPASGPVGYPWDGGNIGSWPGAQASNGLDTNGMTMSNHLPLSKDGIAVGGINVARSSSDDQLLKGGRKMKRKGKGQKGGFFQEIVNLGRGIQHNVNGGYFNLMGKTQPISQNPYPTQEQPIDGDYKYIGQPPVDVRKIYIDANDIVSKI